MHTKFGLICVLAMACGAHAAGAAVVDNKSGRVIAVPLVTGAGVNILESFPNSDDCDDIRFIETPRSDGFAGFHLRRASSVPGRGMWGKRIEVFVDGNQRGLLNAPGDGTDASPGVLVLPADLYKAQLHVMKDKAFGVMTGVYQIVGLSRFGGRDVDIVWVKDRCP